MPPLEQRYSIDMRRVAHANEGGGSKLRARRVRRQRDRERSMDEDELKDRFSRMVNLSHSAPVFVPAAQRASQSPPSPKRSMAFVTEQRGSTAYRNTSCTPSIVPSSTASSRRHKRSTIATAAAKLHKTMGAKKNILPQQQMGEVRSSNANTRRKPRRPRMGSKDQTEPSSKAAAASMQERHRRKLSLTSSELLTPSTSRELEVEKSSAKVKQVVDDVYPETAGSAFPQQLTLFSQQKRLPQRVASRDDVIDTIFIALFSGSKNRQTHPRQAISAFGEDTGTETDEPNEEFVKRELANALFKDQLNLHLSSLPTTVSPAAAADSLITPTFIHALVNALRFEDFRTASARLDILRAIHKSFPTKRLHLARALADATTFRVEYVLAVVARAQMLGVEKTSKRVITDHSHDHGHGFTELLRYLIEHVEGSLLETRALHTFETRQREFVRNCMASLVSLLRAHWIDPTGSDDEELISSAGQFVAYMPSVTGLLLQRLLSAWPTHYPKYEVGATRMLARVIMSGPPLQQVDPTRTLQRRVFQRLARALQSLHVDVAKEALAFTGCQFVLVHFLSRDDVIYRAITEALHANVAKHWHDGVRHTSEANFDRALDYAPE
ncbi:hypothetical protein PsorP6_017399 [Peronosclerospora sorghi]|uniref:Uncharacterized protein n=1 Tax=Peronosclerospora sorghi TaxID=230839 RepID=A0ACC0WNB0_9STRA|nr:hypothetical protein PsorP6_017399 [Peronosclerospora sorghi]